MVDKAVSTEDAELSEGSQVTEGSQVSEGWKSLDGILCIMGGIQALVGRFSHHTFTLILTSL
jgi:hypothetical protein